MSSNLVHHTDKRYETTQIAPSILTQQISNSELDPDIYLSKPKRRKKKPSQNVNILQLDSQVS